MAHSPHLFPRRISETVAYTWRHSNAIDVTGNGQDGTLNGNAAVANGILTLDGTGDYVGMSPPFTTATALSLSIWFKIDSIAATDLLYTIEDSSGVVGEGIRVFFRQPTGKIRFDSYASADEKAILESTTSIVAATWYHLGISLSGANSELYLNGVSEDTSADQKHSHTYDAAKVGRWYQSTTLDWGGTVGECRMYDRALTAQEISDIFNNTRSDY